MYPCNLYFHPIERYLVHHTGIMPCTIYSQHDQVSCIVHSQHDQVSCIVHSQHDQVSCIVHSQHDQVSCIVHSQHDQVLMQQSLTSEMDQKLRNKWTCFILHLYSVKMEQLQKKHEHELYVPKWTPSNLKLAKLCCSFY